MARPRMLEDAKGFFVKLSRRERHILEVLKKQENRSWSELIRLAIQLLGKTGGIE